MATETPAPAEAQTAPIAHDQPIETEPAVRRTVTLPVLPLAIIGAVIVAVIFFGGGVALGAAIGDHPSRVGNVQPFGGQNGQNGFGQNRHNGQNRNGQSGNGQSGNGQNGTDQRPKDRPSGAPQNG